MQLADMRRILERIASEQEDDLRKHLQIPPFNVPKWIEEIISRRLSDIPIRDYRNIEQFISDMMPYVNVMIGDDIVEFTARKGEIIDACIIFEGIGQKTDTRYRSFYYFHVNDNTTVYDLLNTLKKDMESGEVNDQLAKHVGRL